MKHRNRTISLLLAMILCLSLLPLGAYAEDEAYAEAELLFAETSVPEDSMIEENQYEEDTEPGQEEASAEDKLFIADDSATALPDAEPDEVEAEVEENAIVIEESPADETFTDLDPDLIDEVPAVPDMATEEDEVPEAEVVPEAEEVLAIEEEPAIEPQPAAIEEKSASEPEFALDGDGDERLSIPELKKLKLTQSGPKLSWKAVSGAGQYQVLRIAGDENTYKTITITSNTSYTDETAKAGKTYTYTVQCLSLEGIPVSEYDTIGLSINYLKTPTLKSCAAIGAVGGVKIKWKSVNGAAQYQILRRVGTNKLKVLSVTGETSYTDDSVKAGRTYTYTVRCLSAEGAIVSQYDTEGLTITYLKAPALKDAANRAAGIRIKWGAVKNAAQYRVYRMTKGSGKWKQLTDTTGTSYTDKTAVSGKTYYYTVQCLTADGTPTGACVTDGIACFRLEQPTLVSAVAGEKKITVTWDAVKGAKKYVIYRKTMNGEWEKIKTVKSNVTEYEDKSIVAGTAYIYTVQAIAGKNKSAYDTTGLIQAGWKDMSLITYYAKGNSRPTYIDGKMYLITQDGHLVTDTTVALLGKTWTVTSKGVIKGYVTDVMKSAAAALDWLGWDLKAGFNWVVKFVYYNRWMRPEPGTDGTQKYFASKTPTEIVHSTWYAEYGFANQKGNCLVMNATLYQLEKVLGFDCYFLEGYVKGSTSLSPHGWTEVVLNRYIYVFDANFTNETGRNGFCIWYGKANTWYYTNGVYVN